MFSDISCTDFRRKEYKSDREIWCTTRMCELLKLDNFTLQPKESPDSIDVIVAIELIRYNIQVTEIAPKDKDVSKLFENQINDMIGFDYKEETSIIINNAIKKKESIQYADANKINLLLYLNSPRRKLENTNLEIYNAVFFTIATDIDVFTLREAHKNSRFGSIILMLDDDIVFLKNQNLVQANL